MTRKPARWALCAGAVGSLALLLALTADEQVYGLGQHRGAALFREKGCFNCHRVGEVGGILGPDLTHVGARLSRELIEQVLTDPRSADPRAIMPDPPLLPPERTELVTFLGGLD